MSFWVVLFGALAIAAWVVTRVSQPPDRIHTELPAELQGAKLWGKERLFECDDPPLRGRIDEAFVVSNGDLALSDTKTRTRRRVYASDVLQVSAYKVMIEASTRMRVRPQGYIRVLSPGGNAYINIRLLPKAEVVAARQLHEDLTRGLYVGDKCGNPAICAGCAYKDPCDRMGG